MSHVAHMRTLLEQLTRIPTAAAQATPTSEQASAWASLYATIAAQSAAYVAGELCQEAGEDHVWYLFCAECARVEGNYGAAREYYDQAIQLALQHNAPHDAALSNRQAARLYLDRQQERLAQLYLQDAVALYLRCGNFDEVGYLTASYPQCFHSDMPERTAQELYESQTLLHGLLNHVPAFLYVKDLMGCYMLVNKRYADWLNQPIDQIIGRYESELFPAVYIAQWTEQDAQVIATGQPLQAEEAMHRDGIDYTYLVTLFPLRDSQGNIYALGGISVDISSQKRVEKHIREQEEHYYMLAVETVQLYQQAERRAEEAETIRQASIAITSTNNEHETIDRILEELARVIPYDGASVQVRQGNESVVIGGQGVASGVLEIGKRYPIQAGTIDTYVYNQAQPYLITEARNDRLFQPYTGGIHEIRAWLGLPLVINQRVVGMLTLDSLEPNSFTMDHIRVGTIFANHVAIAIENARLLSSLRRRAEEAEILSEAGLAITATLDRQEAITRILEQLARVVPHDSSSIQLRSGDDTEVVAARGFPKGPNILGMRFAIPNNFAHNVLYYERRPFIIPDTDKSPWFSNPLSHNIKSWLGLPLIRNDEVIGLLGLDSHTAYHFTAEHVKLGMAFASQVAIGLDNALLYQRVKHAHARLLLLNQASRAISAASRNPEQVYLAIDHAVQTLLPASDSFAVLLFDSHMQMYESAYILHHEVRQPIQQYSLPGSFVASMIQRGAPLLSNDLLNLHQGPLLPGSPAEGSAMAVPLQLGQQTHGLLVVQHAQRHRYTEDDLGFFALIATHAVVALENARLFVTDFLTGLFNRAYFFTLLEREHIRAQRYEVPFAILMIDIDNFKHVNDTYGHSVGDEVLRQVAQISLQTLREADSMGRYGGEELIALLPLTDQEAATDAAERLRVGLSAIRVTYQDIQIAITVSIGIAISFGNTAPTIAVLIDQADAALNEAKRNGKNQIMLWHSLPPQAMHPSS